MTRAEFIISTSKDILFKAIDANKMIMINPTDGQIDPKKFGESFKTIVETVTKHFDAVQ